ncbi:hypothetical protein DRW42_21770 [Pedobacter miscanthi]|uniref:Uncharacterized protein n=1 Tax=Pedobacter miscanthi TaxID=2259170 RepID=A0A366KQH6_9SPHI|nr:hypothetical protein DRW42_21770 [Pedobacter miscanthi]
MATHESFLRNDLGRQASRRTNKGFFLFWKAGSVHLGWSIPAVRFIPMNPNVKSGGTAAIGFMWRGQ